MSEYQGHDESAERRAAKDEVIVAALATGASYAQAAVAADVGERTVARRMENPAFVARVSEARRQYLSAVAGRLLAGAPVALDVIFEVMLGADRPADKLRAAEHWVHLAQRYHQIQELDTRLREIERRLDEGDGGREA